MGKSKTAAIESLEGAIRIAGNPEGLRLNSVISRISGYMNSKADFHPDALCRVEEVQEVFERLFEIMLSETNPDWKEDAGWEKAKQ